MKYVETYSILIFGVAVLGLNIWIVVKLCEKIKLLRKTAKSLQENINNVYYGINEKKAQLYFLKKDFNETDYKKKKEILESRVARVLKNDKERIDQSLSQYIDDIRDIINNNEKRINELMTEISIAKCEHEKKLKEDKKWEHYKNMECENYGIDSYQ